MIKPSAFLKCLFGPRLLRIYLASGITPGIFVPNAIEKFGDGVLRLVNWTLYIGAYTSPLLLATLYRRNFFTNEGLNSLIRLSAVLSTIAASALLIRTYGRCNNINYLFFIKKWSETRESSVNSLRDLSSLFDYEFSAQPLDYFVKKQSFSSKRPSVFNNDNSSLIGKFVGQICGYLIAHTFGIRLLYPGTIIQHFIEPHLVEGRANLIEKHGGKRHKIGTRDGNSIDTIFIDRRQRSGNPKGNYLVICCEGNAGFYEVGMIATPVEAEYSVLGWNHPGFGGSSGLPYPQQEQHAVDAVMQFAVEFLGFSVNKIIIYGWSIGGFTASWVAMNYPDVHAVLLDATFDHILPLAANVMPPSWKVLVDVTVKHHLNLDVANQLAKYHGPVLLFRRTRDEVISLEPGEVSTNRGNHLLLSLLKSRYPHIIQNSVLPILHEWLSKDIKARLLVNEKYEVSKEKCTKILAEHRLEYPETYPLSIGDSWSDNERIQLSLFLAEKYLWDFDSTHCTPLPVEMFRLPQEYSKELYELSK